MLKNVQIPEELYESLQELKGVFSELTGENIKEDADVIGILLSAFIDSVQGNKKNELNKKIIK